MGNNASNINIDKNRLITTQKIPSPSKQETDNNKVSQTSQKKSHPKETNPSASFEIKIELPLDDLKNPKITILPTTTQKTPRDYLMTERSHKSNSLNSQEDQPNTCERIASMLDNDFSVIAPTHSQSIIYNQNDLQGFSSLEEREQYIKIYVNKQLDRIQNEVSKISYLDLTKIGGQSDLSGYINTDKIFDKDNFGGMEGLGAKTQGLNFMEEKDDRANYGVQDYKNWLPSADTKIYKNYIVKESFSCNEIGGKNIDIVSAPSHQENFFYDQKLQQTKIINRSNKKGVFQDNNLNNNKNYSSHNNIGRTANTNKIPDTPLFNAYCPVYTCSDGFSYDAPTPQNESNIQGFITGGMADHKLNFQKGKYAEIDYEMTEQVNENISQVSRGLNSIILKPENFNVGAKNVDSNSYRLDLDTYQAGPDFNQNLIYNSSSNMEDWRISQIDKLDFNTNSYKNFELNENYKLQRYDENKGNVSADVLQKEQTNIHNDSNIKSSDNRQMTKDSLITNRKLYFGENFAVNDSRSSFKKKELDDDRSSLGIDNFNHREQLVTKNSTERLNFSNSKGNANHNFDSEDRNYKNDENSNYYLQNSGEGGTSKDFVADCSNEKNCRKFYNAISNNISCKTSANKKFSSFGANDKKDSENKQQGTEESDTWMLYDRHQKSSNHFDSLFVNNCSQRNQKSEISQKNENFHKKDEQFLPLFSYYGQTQLIEFPKKIESSITTNQQSQMVNKSVQTSLKKPPAFSSNIKNYQDTQNNLLYSSSLQNQDKDNQHQCHSMESPNTVDLLKDSLVQTQMNNACSINQNIDHQTQQSMSSNTFNIKNIAIPEIDENCQIKITNSEDNFKTTNSKYYNDTKTNYMSRNTDSFTKISQGVRQVDSTSDYRTSYQGGTKVKTNNVTQTNSHASEKSNNFELYDDYKKLKGLINDQKFGDFAEKPQLEDIHIRNYLANETNYNTQSTNPIKIEYFTSNPDYSMNNNDLQKIGFNNVNLMQGDVQVHNKKTQPKEKVNDDYMDYDITSEEFITQSKRNQLQMIGHEIMTKDQLYQELSPEKFEFYKNNENDANSNNNPNNRAKKYEQFMRDQCIEINNCEINCSPNGNTENYSSTSNHNTENHITETTRNQQKIIGEELQKNSLYNRSAPNSNNFDYEKNQDEENGQYSSLTDRHKGQLMLIGNEIMKSSSDNFMKNQHFSENQNISENRDQTAQDAPQKQQQQTQSCEKDYSESEKTNSPEQKYTHHEQQQPNNIYIMDESEKIDFLTEDLTKKNGEKHGLRLHTIKESKESSNIKTNRESYDNMMALRESINDLLRSQTLNYSKTINRSTNQITTLNNPVSTHRHDDKSGECTQILTNNPHQAYLQSNFLQKNNITNNIQSPNSNQDHTQNQKKSIEFLSNEEGSKILDFSLNHKDSVHDYSPIVNISNSKNNGVVSVGTDSGRKPKDTARSYNNNIKYMIDDQNNSNMVNQINHIKQKFVDNEVLMQSGDFLFGQNQICNTNAGDFTNNNQNVNESLFIKNIPIDEKYNEAKAKDLSLEIDNFIASVDRTNKFNTCVTDSLYEGSEEKRNIPSMKISNPVRKSSPPKDFQKKDHKSINVKNDFNPDDEQVNEDMMRCGVNFRPSNPSQEENDNHQLDKDNYNNRKTFNQKFVKDFEDRQLLNKKRMRNNSNKKNRDKSAPFLVQKNNDRCSSVYKVKDYVESSFQDEEDLLNERTYRLNHELFNENKIMVGNDSNDLKDVCQIFDYKNNNKAKKMIGKSNSGQDRFAQTNTPMRVCKKPKGEPVNNTDRNPYDLNSIHQQRNSKYNKKVNPAIFVNSNNKFVDYDDQEASNNNNQDEISELSQIIEDNEIKYKELELKYLKEKRAHRDDLLSNHRNPNPRRNLLNNNRHNKNKLELDSCDCYSNYTNLDRNNRCTHCGDSSINSHKIKNSSYCSHRDSHTNKTRQPTLCHSCYGCNVNPDPNHQHPNIVHSELVYPENQNSQKSSSKNPANKYFKQIVGGVEYEVNQSSIRVNNNSIVSNNDNTHNKKEDPYDLTFTGNKKPNHNIYPIQDQLPKTPLKNKFQMEMHKNHIQKNEIIQDFNNTIYDETKTKTKTKKVLKHKPRIPKDPVAYNEYKKELSMFVGDTSLSNIRSKSFYSTPNRNSNYSKILNHSCMEENPNFKSILY